MRNRKNNQGDKMLSKLLIPIFYDIDEFCKIFLPIWQAQLIDNGKQRNRQGNLTLSEIMTIVVLFHISGYRTFKDFYIQYAQIFLQPYFPKLVSYNRFIELMPSVVVPILVYLKRCKMGSKTGISFIDSTSLSVCHNRRNLQNKTFKNFAERGKTSMGWFFGFKLHLIINDKGEIISFALTTGNVSDNNLKLIESLSRKLFGKLFGDRGYISQKLSKNLFSKGVQLITKTKKNMKNQFITFFDKILLRKRAIIESVNDELKNICQVEHSRHRSPINFLVNLFAGLVAYSFFPKKPSINFGKALSPLYF
jgi:hypothetical protein